MACCLVNYFENELYNRAVRQVLSWTAGTLGSWVRIPLKAWMYFLIYLYCAVLAMGRSPVQGVLPKNM